MTWSFAIVDLQNVLSKFVVQVEQTRNTRDVITRALVIATRMVQFVVLSCVVLVKQGKSNA